MSALLDAVSGSCKTRRLKESDYSGEFMKPPSLATATREIATECH